MPTLADVYALMQEWNDTTKLFGATDEAFSAYQGKMRAFSEAFLEEADPGKKEMHNFSRETELGPKAQQKFDELVAWYKSIPGGGTVEGNREQI